MPPRTPGSEARPDQSGRRRVVRLGALVGILLAAVLMGPSEGPHVAEVSGEVEIGSGVPPVWRAAMPGDFLAPGDSVRTGRDGRAELMLTGSTVRLYGDSLLRLPDESMGPGGAEEVSLERGDSLFDVLRREGRSRFEVHTPDVVVSVKGTRFSVSVLDQAASVSVFRGLVGVRVLALEMAHEALVREGFGAVGGSGLAVQLFVDERPDPWEAWAPEAQLLVPQRAAQQMALPGKLALVEAREVARKAYRREAVEQAALRHPAVAQKVAEALAKADPEKREQYLKVLQRRDPLTEAREGRVKQNLEIAYVEQWINGDGSAVAVSPAPPGPAALASPTPSFDISVVSGSGVSGGDRVQVDETTTISSWTFDDAFLDDVINGSQNLPNTLAQMLQTQGADEIQFVKLLVTLLDGG